jgi:hypothetical protein
LALEVASIWRQNISDEAQLKRVELFAWIFLIPMASSQRKAISGGAAYRENTNGVDSQLVQISETHDGGF